MSSLRPFFAGIIDYAGLFPPARLDMSGAVHAYAEYSSGPDADLLGRFVVPAARLEEFSAVAGASMPRDAKPWKLSVIAGDDLVNTRTVIEQFNAAHDVRSTDSRAVIDTVELPVSSHDAIRSAVGTFDDHMSVFLEVSALTDPRYLIAAIGETFASAKLRTGGIVESAIPDMEHVLRFIEACVEEGVPFKATAGLHHAVRGRYPLTYEQDAPDAMMFGYLNLFLAAALCAAGSSQSAVLGALQETDASNFKCDDAGVWWQDHVVVHEQLPVIRQAVATSFGSCSFTEPVDEARNLHLI